MATEGLPSLKSLRERSDDSNFQLQVPQCLSRFPATDALPIFPGGDVIVRSDLVDPPKQWQFHSTGLVRQSTWFARDIHEQQLTSTKTTDWYLYGIEEVDGQVKLSRRPAEGPRPITVQSQNDDLLERTTVKREDDDSDALYKTILHVYDQIFKAFYGLPSLITPSNIQLATSQAEQLVKVATDLGCIHLVSSQIGNALLQYRQTLYKAILADPPRYLLLSLVLENDFIYTESLIHLVGAHPCYPWPTPHTTLPEHTKRLIARKSLDLDIEVLRVERELLLLTITTHRGTSYSPDQHSQFDTWFIVQYFRNTLTEVLREHDAAKPALKRGNFFRKIRSGRYMEYEQVRQQVQKIMPSAVDTLEEDLRILKECASEIVEEMARNEASLDVEESKVGWLTCVKVEGKDIPWRAVAVSEA